jgi:ATP-dependent helicase YprA (DUF1998 family)
VKRPQRIGLRPRSGRSAGDRTVSWGASPAAHDRGRGPPDLDPAANPVVAAGRDAAEVWEEVNARIVELISQHKTTLLFVNTRRLCERMAMQLSERLGADKVTSHHGSLSREKRLEAEERLKRGELQVLVATASLELGIDIGSVDLVIQVGSTRSIATLLQRVGRAGHRLGAVPKGRVFPLSPGGRSNARRYARATASRLDATSFPTAAGCSGAAGGRGDRGRGGALWRMRPLPISRSRRRSSTTSCRCSWKGSPRARTAQRPHPATASKE